VKIFYSQIYEEKLCHEALSRYISRQAISKEGNAKKEGYPETGE